MIEALLPKTRRSVLGLLFARTDQAFYLRQVVRAMGAGRGAVERELQSLAEGASLHKVQYAAGHADPRTTERYDRQRETLVDNAVDYVTRAIERVS